MPALTSLNLQRLNQRTHWLLLAKEPGETAVGESQGQWGSCALTPQEGVVAGQNRGEFRGQERTPGQDPCGPEVWCPASRPEPFLVWAQPPGHRAPCSVQSQPHPYPELPSTWLMLRSNQWFPCLPSALGCKHRGQGPHPVDFCGLKA